MTVIEGLHVGKYNIKCKKIYRWFVPKELRKKVRAGDIAWVYTKNGPSPVLIIRVLKMKTGVKYSPIFRVTENKKKKLKLLQEQALNDIKIKENEIESKIEKSEVDINVEEKVKEVKKRGRFSEAEKEEIRAKRAEGKKLKEIAEMYSCSISLIHRIVKEK